jgi:hypothetical protein
VVLPADAHDLDVRGSGTTLKASENFRGRALLVVPAGRNIRVHDLSLDGDRDATGRMVQLPPQGTQYSRFLAGNGIVVEGVMGIEIFSVKATRMPAFAVLVNASHNVKLHEIEVSDSGGLNLQRRNNGTGGLALEEGSSDFEIRHCRFGGIRGTAVTLRNTQHGVVGGNEFAMIARDAIRATDSVSVTMENNVMHQIGFPIEEVDARATCVTLDHVTSGEIRGNTCSGALLGAIVVDGADNRITNNHLTGLNVAHRDTSGIYLEPGVRNATIEGNEIAGAGMAIRCVGAAPSVQLSASRIAKNDCSDEASVAGLRLKAVQHSGFAGPLATLDTAFTSFRYEIFAQSSTGSISPSRQPE